MVDVATEVRRSAVERPDAGETFPAASFTPTSAAGSSLLVRIDSGPQAGGTAVLPPGRHVIGTSLGADIVLADPHVAPRHFEVQLSDHAAIVMALEAEVFVDHGTTLSPGGRLVLREPVELLVGTTRIHLAPPSPALAAERRRRQVAGVALIAIGGLGLVAMLALNLTTPSAPGLGRMQFVPAAAIRPPASPPLDIGALQQVLADEGLVTVSAQVAEGAVRIAGWISPDQRPVLDRVLAEFEAKHRGRIAVVSAVTTVSGSDLPKLTVQAVDFGPIPFVIAGGGHRLTEGAVLPGGWVLERITRDQLAFRRGSQRVELRL